MINQCCEDGMLNLGWVDFSKSDRDMVLSVIRQLTERGAVDELGIGTIRDGFSDILFPGTSTIQTRAKYMFIIPYLCMELERGGKLSPREFIEALEKKEIDLIDILDVNGAEGVIGQRARQTLRRKPSSVYWNALRTFGFISEAVSLSEYASLVCTRKIALEHLKTSGKLQSCYENDTTDDADTGKSGASFWRVPIDENWCEKLTIGLTAEEAAYLRRQITTRPATSNSLLSLVLKENRLDFTQFENFGDIDTIQKLMTPKLRRDYQLARDFSRFIFGAQIRYNVIYSGGQNKCANILWAQYVSERPQVNLAEIQERLKPRAKVMRFLKMYQNTLDDIDELDKLIIRREKELKGVVRAKLSNTELYQYDDNSVNMTPLTYRLAIAQRIVRDIFEGAKDNA